MVDFFIGKGGKDRGLRSWWQRGQRVLKAASQLVCTDPYATSGIAIRSSSFPWIHSCSSNLRMWLRWAGGVGCTLLWWLPLKTALEEEAIMNLFFLISFITRLLPLHWSISSNKWTPFASLNPCRQKCWGVCDWTCSHRCAITLSVPHIHTEHVDGTWCCIAALDKRIKKLHRCPRCTLLCYLVFLIFWGGKPAPFLPLGVPPLNITWLGDESFDTGIFYELNMISCIIKNFPCKQKAALFMSEFRFCLLNAQISLLLQHSQPSAAVLITHECDSLFVELKKKAIKLVKY